MEAEEKKQLNRPDAMYIVSMVLFAVAAYFSSGPTYHGSYTVNDVTYYGNYWFITIGVYALIGFLCYLLGFIKIKRYNNSSTIISNYEYRINSFYGFFNLMMILPLNFGLLFMILTNDVEGYATLMDVFVYFSIAIFFLVDFILRKTILKKKEFLGVCCFDMNSFIYFGYAFLMLLLNYLGIKVDQIVLGALFVINLIIVHVSAYYPAKAIVYATYYEEYNPIQTIYLFIRKLIDRKIFFYIGLAFTSMIGVFYLTFATEGNRINLILFMISMFYFGVAILRFFGSFWNQKIEESNETQEEKYKSQNKIMLFYSIATFILTILLSSMFIFTFYDKIDKNVSIIFLLFQGNFVSVRIMFTIMDLIKAHRRGNPYTLAAALNGVLYTMVLIYSFLLSLFIYFGFGDYLFLFSIIFIAINLHSSLLIAVYMLFRYIIVKKGVLKRKE